MKNLFSEVPPLKSGPLVLCRLTGADAPGLKELVDNPNVYRYLPTFLFEKKYADVGTVIQKLYGECLKESLIFGIFLENDFCGLIELYGFCPDIHKVSIGYRLPERCWGRGIASRALKSMVDYLYSETDIEIITASTMVENKASEKVLLKNGFDLAAEDVGEDWGYPVPTRTDKWIRQEKL